MINPPLKLDTVEIIYFNEINCYSLRHEFWPYSWNDGIVEQWNIGFSKEKSIFNFIQYCRILSEPQAQ